jgi:hypothetical protein
MNFGSAGGTDEWGGPRDWVELPLSQGRERLSPPDLTTLLPVRMMRFQGEYASCIPQMWSTRAQMPTDTSRSLRVYTVFREPTI